MTDPRRPEIQGSMKGCGDLAALAITAALFSGAAYATGLIALIHVLGGF